MVNRFAVIVNGFELLHFIKYQGLCGRLYLVHVNEIRCEMFDFSKSDLSGIHTTWHASEN
jgi:hypothetical protein